MIATEISDSFISLNFLFTPVVPLFIFLGTGSEYSSPAFMMRYSKINPNSSFPLYNGFDLGYLQIRFSGHFFLLILST